jgi:RNase adaptor protein for sRNA GlmZ degradation
LKLVLDVILQLRASCVWDEEMASAPVIWAWCRRGRHRSVGFATLVAEVLRHLGFQVTVEHWMRNWWYCCD